MKWNFFLIFSYAAVATLLDFCPVYDQNIIDAFSNKTCLNQLAIEENPYLSNTYEISHTNEGFCALKYTDKDFQSYILKSFPTEKQAERNGFYVTHSTHCGSCSTTQDLSVYMSHPDMTTTGIICSIFGLIDEEKAIQCYETIGLSRECSKIWWYNGLNTRNECFQICLMNIGAPPNNDDGSLNDCLQCDEDMSGDIFKEFSGRTRRNSGLPSNIDRPEDEMYNIIHDYY